MAPLYPPYTGGSATYFSTLAQTMDSYDLSILTAYHKEMPLVEESQGHKIYRVVPRIDSFPSTLRMLLEGVGAFFAAIYIYFIEGADISHTHSTSYLSPGVALFSVLAGVSIIYDCRDEDFPTWLVTLGNPSAIYSCSSHIDDILTEAGVSSEKIIRVPVTPSPYIDQAVSTDHNANDQKFTIIFVGKIRELKGIKLLVSAFNRFVSDFARANLRIVGEGPLRDEIESEIDNLKISEKVTVLGKLSHRKTLSEIAEADVLVLPSKSEGVPRTIIEAFSLGTPVIATRAGGIPEIVTDGETGVLIERSVQEIRDGLEVLYLKPDWREQIGEAARSESEQWTWETAQEQIEEGYRKAI